MATEICRESLSEQPWIWFVLKNKGLLKATVLDSSVKSILLMFEECI